MMMVMTTLMTNVMMMTDLHCVSGKLGFAFARPRLPSAAQLSQEDGVNPSPLDGSHRLQRARRENNREA